MESPCGIVVKSKVPNSAYQVLGFVGRSLSAASGHVAYPAGLGGVCHVTFPGWPTVSLLMASGAGETACSHDMGAVSSSLCGDLTAAAESFALFGHFSSSARIGAGFVL